MEATISSVRRMVFLGLSRAWSRKDRRPPRESPYHRTLHPKCLHPGSCC